MESVSEEGLDDQSIPNVVEWLHIPESKQKELRQQYPVVAQRKWAYSAYFLAHHPGPSWRIIANALWENLEHGALEVVQKLYLKGEPCADSCWSEGRINWQPVYCNNIQLLHTPSLNRVNYYYPRCGQYSIRLSASGNIHAILLCLLFTKQCLVLCARTLYKPAH